MPSRSPHSRHSLPLIVAHRGASAHRAEHTMAAYVLALEQSADGVECDVRLTRDGHLVCVHDRRVDRTSTGRGPVSTQNLATLAAHDYGSWYDDLGVADDLVRQRVSGRSTAGLLTLAELLGLVADCSRPVRLFVETKHPVRHSGLVEAKLVALLARYGLAAPESKKGSTVLVMSFSARALRRVRTAAPGLPTVQLMTNLRGLGSGELPFWADVAGPGVHALRADPGFVERAAAHGHPTYCWTVDEPADIGLCAEYGVSYLATNRPGDARRVLRASSQPPTDTR
ncbi:MAG TPA: glycerophosphodiester phosphodiesterase family protein [Pseudonocardiaceae bacterium]